jgi:prepilin-type processing-associated H-X9-DG protein
MKAGRRSAFTLIELVAVVGTVVTSGAVFALVLGPGGGGGQPAKEKQPQGPGKQADQLKELGIARAKARQVKDEANLRSIIEAMHAWAKVNKDHFPLPSEIDVNGKTVAGADAAKDTTANIFSVLIYMGQISTDACVSAAEASANISVDKNYMFDAPTAAVTPTQALWDPAFSADFTGGKTGNVSFAHLQPAGGRKAHWSATFMTSEAVVGNRGPRISKVADDADGIPVASVADPNTLTFLIHGDRDKWEGNIAYNDGHVNFERTLLPRVKPESNTWPTYSDKDGKRHLDCLFYDEPDDAAGANAFLGIFTKSGAAVKDWQAIWD